MTTRKLSTTTATERIKKTDAKASTTLTETIKPTRQSPKKHVQHKSTTKRSTIQSTMSSSNKSSRSRHYKSYTDPEDNSVIRCRSALQYSHRDSFQTTDCEQRDEPTSLPSSPSRLVRHLNKNQNSTKLLTSEVFTRTVDSSKSIEVIYRQPTALSEAIRRTQEYKYMNDVDVSFIDTTDSSLSDSIALPSSSSEYDVDYFGKRKRSCSPASPKPYKRAIQLKEQQQKIRRSDIGMIKSTTTEEDEKNLTHEEHEMLLNRIEFTSNVHSQFACVEQIASVATSTITSATLAPLPSPSPPPPPIEASSMSDIAVAASPSELAAGADSCLSPILDYRAVTPHRQKHKFDNQSVVSDTGKCTNKKMKTK